MTSSGKLFVIFYALIGIPLCLVMLAGIASKITSIAQCVGDKIEYCRSHPKAGKGITSVIIIIVGSMAFIVVPSITFSFVEGWSYNDSVYFAFVTLSTIGFGDFIPGTLQLIDHVNSYDHY